MSRTFKDAPAARKSRRERLADQEIPFEYQPADNAGAWESFADPGLSAASRTAAALWLGLRDPEPSDAQLLAAPCPHWDATGDRISCTEAEADGALAARVELTLIAGGN